MTCLTIVQKACDKMQGVARPTAVASSSDPGVQQLLELLNEAGKELARDHDWSSLVTARTFSGVATQAQTGEPPAAFDRFVSGGQIFDTSTKRPLVGSIDQNRFNWLTIQTIGGSDRYWTMIGGVLNITPVPAITDQFKYVYVSKNWVNGTADAFTADADTTLLDEELLKLALVSRWKQVKTLDYGEDMKTFEREKERLIARDKGPRTVSFSRIYDNLPDGFWPDHIG
jgi:hypothetical protein